VKLKDQQQIWRVKNDRAAGKMNEISKLKKALWRMEDWVIHSE
jgi:hypothetical protein